MAARVDLAAGADPVPPAVVPVPAPVVPSSPDPARAQQPVGNQLAPAPAPVVTIQGAGPGPGVGPFWAPGGYEPRTGSPYLYHDPRGGQFVVTGNPYDDHWGPGFHRHSLYGHYRFPYSTYRAPWYYPGRAVYNRDTNLPW
jgi:hypothetical protein